MFYLKKELILNLSFKELYFFIDWWKTEIGDLVYFPLCGSTVEIKNKEACKINDEEKKGYIDKVSNKPIYLRIPIFSDTQLKKFLEDKIGKTIIIEESNIDNYLYMIKIDESIIYSNDLLDTYWKEALKIIRNLIKKEKIS